jgi:peptide/nickel transport system substrate-binding protein
MQQSYWSAISSHRLHRRRALTLTGGAALGAGLLTACGGGESGGESNKSGLVVKPVETTKQAKRGGILKSRTFANPGSLDVNTPNNPITPFANNVYSSLVLLKPGYLEPAQEEIGADLAESWEYSPDGLQITLKLRQGVKFHNKPPINGRALDMDDVLFTWKRFSEKYSGRTGLVNSVNPDAPVLSFTASDSKTIVIKLKEPLVYALALFIPSGASGVYILPKETDSTLDLRGDMLGTGPWYLADYQSSVAVTLKRNPEFYDKDWALVEQIDLPIVLENAQALAQFKAGNIIGTDISNNVAIRQEDVLSLVKEEPRILMYQGDLQAAGSVQNFGWLPAGKSPFLDERVRQAVSMAIDRDIFIDTVLNGSKFVAEGLPVTTGWSTALASTQAGWWLDPQGKDFGPNAKYFRHDPAEAKKLLAAAGYPTGFEIPSVLPGIEYPPGKFGEIIDGMAAEIGIKTRLNQVDYLKDYIPNYRDGHGQYEGWSYTSTAGGVTGGSSVGILAARFWSKGGNAFAGFSSSGKNDQAGDPQVETMIEKARLEPDTEKRRALVFELQRYLAKTMYALNSPGGASGFLVAWPALGNFRVWQGARTHYRYWIDDTKAPFKSA